MFAIPQLFRRRSRGGTRPRACPTRPYPRCLPRSGHCGLPARAAGRASPGSGAPWPRARDPSRQRLLAARRNFLTGQWPGQARPGQATGQVTVRDGRRGWTPARELRPTGRGRGGRCAPAGGAGPAGRVHGAAAGGGACRGAGAAAVDGSRRPARATPPQGATGHAWTAVPARSGGHAARGGRQQRGRHRGPRLDQPGPAGPAVPGPATPHRRNRPRPRQ